MADQTNANGADILEEALGRVAKKAGVKATIVLDRATGSILKTSGQISSIKVSKPLKPTPPGPSSDTAGTESDTALTDETQGAEQLAAMVWSFVTIAGTLVQDIDGDDELKLLRLRTRKQELVILPDPKYLLIVIHDTPPA